MIRWGWETWKFASNNGDSIW